MIINLQGFKKYLILVNSGDKDIRYRIDGEEATEDYGFLLGAYHKQVAIKTPNYLSIYPNDTKIVIAQSDTPY